MKGLLKLSKLTFTLLIGTGAAIATAAVPSGYYDSLEGLSGVNLKKAAKSIARSHTAISYGDATWSVFETSDVHYVNGSLVWWDMYSPNNVLVSSGHPGMNIEHAVANSWWGGTKNDAYKDLFHLNPSNSDANSRKSNYPLGIIGTGTWDNGVTFVGKPKSGYGGGSSYVYEPADQYKGDFARAFFYMFTIYDDIAWKDQWDWMYDVSSDLLLKPWAYQMLLQWAKDDPVSQKEIDRNEAIYKNQKNRNPFIDNPELAEYIWGSKKNTPYHYDPNYDPGTDPDPDPDPDPDDPNVTPVPAGYWYAVTSSTQLNSSDKYVIVYEEENVALSVNVSSNNKYFMGCSKSPSLDTSVSPTVLSGVPEDVAVLSLTPSGSGWTLAVATLDGEFKGYLKSTEAKALGYSPTADSNCVVTITPSAEKTRLTYKYSSSEADIEYNKNENGLRFTTYASSSNQEKVRLYRLEQSTGSSSILNSELDDNTDSVLMGIYDINGRRVQANSISDLQPGLYIVVTSKGARKIIK